MALGGLVSPAANPARARELTEPAGQEWCARDLDIAYRELKQARAKGVASSVALAQASGLLTGAKIQEEFGKYPNCIDKAQRARLHIKRAALDEGR